MIDLSSETLLTMAQAARLRPSGRCGRPTHTSTIYRWITRGIRHVKLECIRLGGTTYTSREAMQRFAERLTSRSDDASPSSAVSVEPRAADATDQALDDYGF